VMLPWHSLFGATSPARTSTRIVRACRHTPFPAFSHTTQPRSENQPQWLVHTRVTDPTHRHNSPSSALCAPTLSRALVHVSPLKVAFQLHARGDGIGLRLS
jgi:hypothetical protein